MSKTHTHLSTKYRNNANNYHYHLSTLPDILDAEEHESAEGEDGDQVPVLDEGDRVAGQLQGLCVPPQQQCHLVCVKVEPGRRSRPRK